jgi:molecular chaperone GrpE (heat shock protein)
MVVDVARRFAGWLRSAGHSSADRAQRDISRQAAAVLNTLPSLTRDVAELRNILEQQYGAVQNGLEMLESIDQRVVHVWDEHKSHQSEYLRLVSGILRVIDDCHSDAANRSVPSCFVDVLRGLLRDQGIEALPVSEGDSFEPRLQRCEELVQAPQQAPGTVVQVLEAGYVRCLSDGCQSVIRPARVTVTMDRKDEARVGHDG